MPEKDNNKLQEKLQQILFEIETTEDEITIAYSKYNNGSMGNEQAFDHVAEQLIQLKDAKDDIKKLAVEMGATNAYFLMLFLDIKDAIKKTDDALETLMSIPKKNKKSKSKK